MSKMEEINRKMAEAAKQVEVKTMSAVEVNVDSIEEIPMGGGGEFNEALITILMKEIVDLKARIAELENNNSDLSEEDKKTVDDWVEATKYCGQCKYNVY